MNNIKENNKLIANFMGYKYYHPGVDIDTSDCGGIYERLEMFSTIPIETNEYPKDDQYYVKNDYYIKSNGILGNVYFHEAKYHSSYDWLMPVLEKIRQITTFSYINIYNKGITTGCEIRIFNIDNEELFYTYPKLNTEGQKLIDIVYLAIINFIKWYNESELPTHSRADGMGFGS